MSVNKNKRKRLRLNPMRLGILFGLAAICCLVISALISSLFQPSAPSNPTPNNGGGTPVTQEQVMELGKVTSADLLAVKEALYDEVNAQELFDLKDQIDNYLTSRNIDLTKVSWAVQDLTTDASIESANAKTSFTAASTYKLPLCTYYYEQIASGAINPSDTLEFTARMQEKEDAENLNQPIHRKYQVGDQIPIDELLEAALLYSDNIAAHILYENLGGYGAFKQTVSRYSTAKQPADFFMENVNVLNSDYMMDLLHHIYNTPGTFNDLKYWLQNATLYTFLNRDLPGTYIQKVGNLNEVRNAGGIYNGSAPFSLSIYSAISKEEGENLLADLGVLCYNYFQNKYASGYYNGADQERIANLNAQMSSPVDVINTRPGPNGQTIRPLTEEEQKMAQEALRND